MPQLGLDGTVFDGLPDPDPYLMYRYADPKHCYLNTWINKANLSSLVIKVFSTLYSVVLLLQISEESTDSVHSVHTLFVYNCTQYSTVCVNNNKLVHTQACSTYSALPNSGILCLLLVHHNKFIM